jgi:hypothetical protein
MLGVNPCATPLQVDIQLSKNAGTPLDDPTTVCYYNSPTFDLFC